jgi:AsmA family/AsmA-like C-terminal region
LKKLLSKRRLLVACICVAALFAVRLPAWRLRAKVVRSIRAAVGRNVEVGSISIRFLPRPGFALQNLVIDDDPSFGAEPLLRAPEVTASVQITSLLRGHIQIAALSLTGASVNLARDAGGEWNLQDLLQRTSSISVAPTGSRGHASRFPYIEATGARINFKNGPEKLHFALADARFALWQDSENTWGMRLRARPIRTDENLFDTGMVAFNGSWQRSLVLPEMPFQLSFEWDRGEIGQISKLIYGNDKGWRGTATLSADIAGTSEDLKITSDASIDNFRAQDILSDKNLRLAAHCSTDYNLVARSLWNLECVAPSGDGRFELKGSASGLSGAGIRFSDYDLRLTSSDVPVASLLMFVRHARPGFAADLTAAGRTEANFQLSRVGLQPVRVQGSGELQQLVLASISSGASISVGAVPFSVLNDESTLRTRTFLYGSAPNKIKDFSPSAPDIASTGPKMEIGPFNVAMGRSTPLQIYAFVSPWGYQASIHGNAGIKRLLETAPILRIPVPAVNADGTSILDLKIVREWSGDRPKALGSVQLHSVSAQIRGLNDPLVIANANLTLTDEEVSVAVISASAAGATWRGSFELRRPCPAAQACELQFNLHTRELSAASLNQSFNPALREKAWYKFFSRDEDAPGYLLRARATGKVSADKLALGNTEWTHLTANVHLDAGRLSVSRLNGELLGGRVSADLDANFASQPPAYKGAGTLTGISMADVSELMHNAWIDGIGETKYRFTAAGRPLEQVLDSADLTASFSISRAAFPHIALTEQTGPLQAESFSGNVRLRDRQLTFSDTELDTAHRAYAVTGTASLKGALNLRLSTEGVSAFSITGTVLETRVATTPTTAASLKP